MSPGANIVANPEALMDCFRRRTDFPRCVEMTEILNVFGKNLSTVCITFTRPESSSHRFPLALL
jgi:hypothetical protein